MYFTVLYCTASFIIIFFITDLYIIFTIVTYYTALCCTGITVTTLLCFTLHYFIAQYNSVIQN